MFWSWQKDDNFDNLINNADVSAGAIQWVDIRGNLVSVSCEWTGNDRLGQKARLVRKGEVIDSEILIILWQGSSTNMQLIRQKSQN